MIRAATIGDAGFLADIHAACFTESWSGSAILALLIQPGVFAFLTEEKGFVLIRTASDEAEILTLAVIPAARRRGIASALVQAGAGEAGRRGARTLFLEVNENNDAARSLYAELGFAAAGRRRDYYGAGQDALVLQCQLPLGNRSQLD